MTTEPDNRYFSTWAFVSNNSLPSQTATFELNDADPPYDGNTFYAIHAPYGGNIEPFYYPSIDDKYYSGFDFSLPVEQHPGAQTFDNVADLLVSESFSFDSKNPVVDGLAFTRMNAIVKINFVDKTDNYLFSKKGINAVTFGPKTGDKYLTGSTFCQPHDDQYEFYLAAFPEYYDEIIEYYPAYPYVSAEYSYGDRPSIGAIDAVYLIVHPTVLTSSDYPHGFPVEVELDGYSVNRTLTIPEGGIELPAGLVTTLNISLYDNGKNGTTVIEE